MAWCFLSSKDLFIVSINLAPKHDKRIFVLYAGDQILLGFVFFDGDVGHIFFEDAHESVWGDWGDIALESDADTAGFLGDDDGDGVGVLRDA